MKIRVGFFSATVLALSLLIGAACFRLGHSNSRAAAAEVKWVDFNIPAKALSKAMSADIKSHEDEEAASLEWIEILAVLGTKYGGDWVRYEPEDMDSVIKMLAEGKAPGQILEGYKNYGYYYEAYSSVLSGFLGYYEKEAPDVKNPGQTIIKSFYGLKAYSPVAEGYSYSHYSDFGDSRSYGYRRVHMGNDLCGSIGTPIVAVEAGTIEEMGWNQYGGWRMGVRSFDKKRYYYYAHFRSSHPFATGLEAGQEIQAGTVIGYMGMTGYSNEEGANNMKEPHLHFGMQIVLDEGDKDIASQNWIDVYDIVVLLERNRATVTRATETKDFVRKYNMYDERFPYGTLRAGFSL